MLTADFIAVHSIVAENARQHRVEVLTKRSTLRMSAWGRLKKRLLNHRANFASEMHFEEERDHRVEMACPAPWDTSELEEMLGTDQGTEFDICYNLIDEAILEDDEIGHQRAQARRRATIARYRDIYAKDV